MVVDQITEIRRLTLAERNQISGHLNRNEGWKKLIRIIPKIIEIDGEVIEKGLKYNRESERLIENASDKIRGPADILFDEWGTSGRIRPTIKLLLQLLVKAELFRAADYVAVNLLNQSIPERPKTGPARIIDITLPPDDETIEVNKIMSEVSYPDSSTLANGAYVSATIMKNKDFYEKIGHGMVNKVTIDPNEISKIEINGNSIPIPPPRRQKSSSKISNSNNLSSTFNNIPSLSALQLSQQNNNVSNAPIPDLSIMNSEISQISDTSDSSISSESSNFTLPTISNEIPQLSLLQQSQSQIDFIPNLSEFNLTSEAEELPSTKEFNYEDIKNATDNFNSNDLQENGRKIGSGGFGIVYLAKDLVRNVEFAAVKKLQAKSYKCLEKFNIEIKNLSDHSHENLVKLIGFCKDPELCLIYEYIEGGNLQEKLQNCREKLDKLFWKQRIEISMGCANGICYLHEIGLIHRDIKSANILLKGAIPKLCDFGLIKETHSNTTTAIIGTHVYMAPEGFRGDTSEKLDIYSLGVVILELVTGLAVLDKNRQNVDLITYVQEIVSLSTNIPNILIDENAGRWNDDNEINNIPRAAYKFFDVAFMCLEEKMRRPNIEIIKDLLNSIYSDYC